MYLKKKKIKEKRKKKKVENDNLYFFEKFPEDIEDGQIVIGTEHLSDKPSSWLEKLCGELQCGNDKLGLRERILNPCRTDIRRAVVKDDINLPRFDDTSQLVSALSRCDILGQCNDVRNRFDGNNVDTDDDGRERHVLLGNLAPASRGGAKIDQCSASSKEIELFVQLDELKRRTCTVPLIFRQVVVPV